MLAFLAMIGHARSASTIITNVSGYIRMFCVSTTHLTVIDGITGILYSGITVKGAIHGRGIVALLEPLDDEWAGWRRVWKIRKVD